MKRIAFEGDRLDGRVIDLSPESNTFTGMRGSRKSTLLEPDIQFIFATHNPNIPVLGDAEQIIACAYTNDSIDTTIGSIDSPPLQDAIVSIMEGGSEAFRRRKEIYRIWRR